MIDFMDILPVGSQNAVPAKTLMAQLDIADARTLRKMVSAARAEGQLICASQSGYYVPASMIELRAWVNTMHQTIMAMFRDMAGARAVLGDIEDPETIDKGKSE